MDTRRYFFTQQVLKMWSLLLEDVEMATDINNFLKELDKFMEDNSINGYQPC